MLLRKRGGLIITPTTKLSYLLITYIKSLKPESSRQEKISNQIFENLMMILMGPFFLILVFQLDHGVIWKWQMIAGLQQSAQNASAQQSLSNKVRILSRELSMANTRMEAIDRTYIKTGCTIGNDGTKVCISFLGKEGSYFLNVWQFFLMTS